MSDTFCYQCQEAAHNKGCDKGGVCGKTAPVARSQDFLIWAVKGLSKVATRLREACQGAGGTKRHRQEWHGGRRPETGLINIYDIIKAGGSFHLPCDMKAEGARPFSVPSAVEYERKP